jgi:hypothetical protein
MTKAYDASLIGKKLSVVDEMLLLNPYQTPLISLCGFGQPVTQTTHQWFEDELFGDKSTISGAKLATDTSLVVADVEPFRVGHVIKIGDELLYVSAVDTGSKTLTVTRGYASTTPAAISDGAKVEVQFVEGVEGADARAARYKSRTPHQNYTQIFDDSIEVSGTAEAVQQYGVADLYEYEKQKKQTELALQLEKALIGGVAFNNGQVRQMAGIRSLVQTNVTDAANAAASASILNDSLQSIYEAGGFQSGGDYHIQVSPKQKRAISNFDDNHLYVTRADNARGQKVDQFVSDFGQFPIYLNINLDPDEIIICDCNRMAIRPLVGRDFFHKYLGEKGDSTNGILVGEYTLELKQEKAFARIKNLA